MWPGFHGNQESDYGKICGLWRYGNGTSDFPQNSLFCWKIHRKSIWAIICLNLTFSTLFSVNNGHRAIKVHVNKVQYCRAGHILYYWLTLYQHLHSNIYWLLLYGSKLPQCRLLMQVTYRSTWTASMPWKCLWTSQACSHTGSSLRTSISRRCSTTGLKSILWCICLII